jgi:hypothetical protein
MDDIKLALLGNQEAAKRLTDAGVRIPCRCGAKGEIITMAKYGENRWKPAVIRCPKCHYEACLTVWNTRAPILSAEEMEMLEALKDGKGD